eukprot:TRINITY_DN9495_c0_g1_i2.p1 TRINITY_DN9495_c0_g1~~TRINITY_DN9495_c0_g1_i2.p1  ORF type:complete len:354 (-),score=42.99 TRINITY_DN9495_c0_g1_i2:87-1148(-)
MACSKRGLCSHSCIHLFNCKKVFYTWSRKDTYKKERPTKVFNLEKDFTKERETSTKCKMKTHTTHNVLMTIILLMSMSVNISLQCPTPPDFPRMTKYIDGIIAQAGYCGAMQWAFNDFNGNIFSSSNADTGFESASSIKLWVMLSVLKDVQEGTYSLSEPMQCVGKNSTVNDCLELMISVSDNCATYDNIKKTSLVSVNNLLSKLNMKSSALHHWCQTSCPDYSSPCPNDDGTGLNNVLAASDIVNGLESLISFDILNANLTKQAIDYLLTATGWTQMIGRYPPVPVAHKQGWLPAADGFQPLTENDEAIVYACVPYSLAILSQKTWNNTDEDLVALNLGAEISRFVVCFKFY